MVVPLTPDLQPPLLLQHAPHVHPPHFPPGGVPPHARARCVPQQCPSLLPHSTPSDPRPPLIAPWRRPSLLVCSPTPSPPPAVPCLTPLPVAPWQCPSCPLLPRCPSLLTGSTPVSPGRCPSLCTRAAPSPWPHPQCGLWSLPLAAQLDRAGWGAWVLGGAGRPEGLVSLRASTVPPLHFPSSAGLGWAPRGEGLQLLCCARVPRANRSAETEPRRPQHLPPHESVPHSSPAGEPSSQPTPGPGPTLRGLVPGSYEL